MSKNAENSYHAKWNTRKYLRMFCLLTIPGLNLLLLLYWAFLQKTSSTMKHLSRAILIWLIIILIIAVVYIVFFALGTEQTVKVLQLILMD
jgi:polyferredoxin